MKLLTTVSLLLCRDASSAEQLVDRASDLAIAAAQEAWGPSPSPAATADPPAV